MDRLETRRRNDGDHRAAQQAAGGVKKILVASRDFASLDRICSALSPHSDYQLNCTSRAECGLKANEYDEYDLLILDIDELPTLSALLTSVSHSNPATLWVCRETSLVRLIQAAQAEHLAVLPEHIVFKPIAPNDLLESAERTMRTSQQSTLLADKYRKMRQLVRRVVRERREINRRVELVCRDLVEAHRRLTYRFVQMQNSAN